MKNGSRLILFLLVAMALLLAAWYVVCTRIEEKARADEYGRLGIPEDGAMEYVPLPPVVPYDPIKAEKGRRLFVDAKLGASAARSCVRCHNLNEGGLDGKTHRGEPTRPVCNAVFAKRWFWNGSQTNLNDAVAYMITNEWYAASKSFDDVSLTNAADCVVEYLKTRVIANRPFDRYLGGNANAISEEAKRGFKLFKKLDCAKYYEGPGLGGRVLENGILPLQLRGIGKRVSFAMPDGAGGFTVTNSLRAVVERLAPGATGEETDCLEAFLKTL